MNDFTLQQNIYNFPHLKNSTYVNSQRMYWLNPTDTNIYKQNKPKKKLISPALLLVSGIGLLFMSKNVQKLSQKGLEKLKEHFENKVDKSFFEEKKHRISIYEYIIKGINSCISKTEIINNFNSLKDIIFMRLMYKTTPTKKIHQGISKFFEYLSQKTITKSYKKTQKNFNKMYKIFDKLDNYILKNHGNEITEYNNKKYTKKELIEVAKDYRERVRMVVDTFINKKTQNIRYRYMKDTTSQLYSNFWNKSFKNFWKDMWNTFIVSEQIKSNKTDLAENVAFARNMLSYTDPEKRLYISKYLNNLESIIPFEDVEAAEIIKRLRWYIKDTAPLGSNQENFLNDIAQLEKHNIKPHSDENIASAQIKDKETNIKLIKDVIKDSDEGEIQDMINIYHKIAPIELSKSGALNSVNEAVKSFDESANLEIGEMFDKLRDLELGSAPTDILTILMSSAMIVRALEKARDQKEKSAIILKSGIPIAGAISVSLISATKLISGTKSLMLGFISGLILNKLGAILSERHNNPELFNDFQSLI